MCFKLFVSQGREACASLREGPGSCGWPWMSQPGFRGEPIARLLGDPKRSQGPGSDVKPAARAGEAVPANLWHRVLHQPDHTEDADPRPKSSRCPSALRSATGEPRCVAGHYLRVLAVFLGNPTGHQSRATWRASL